MRGILQETHCYLCMFTPLEILYIVLAFCALWISGAVFWLIWQVASVIRNVNDFLSEAREKIERIEQAISSMKERFDHLTSASGVLMEGAKKLFAYSLEKRRSRKDE